MNGTIEKALIQQIVWDDDRHAHLAGQPEVRITFAEKEDPTLVERVLL